MVIEIHTDEGREVIRHSDNPDKNSVGIYTLFKKDSDRVLSAKIISTKEIVIHVVNAINNRKKIVVL
jgi:hypothetical protein